MDGICASLSVVKLVSYGFARGSREATVTVMLELNRVLVLAYESALESPSNTLGGVIQSSVASNMEIKLPINEDELPNWNFMEQYIKSLPYGDRL